MMIDRVHQLKRDDDPRLRVRLQAAHDALRAVSDEITEKAPGRIEDADWNPDAHVELTLTIAECRAVREAMNEGEQAALTARAAEDARIVAAGAAYMNGIPTQPPECMGYSRKLWDAVRASRHTKGASTPEILAVHDAFANEDAADAVLADRAKGGETPKVVTLCGSTRFIDKYNEWRKKLTLDGVIVLSIELVTHQKPDEDPQHVAPDVKEMLDNLHLRKIDLSDEILVLNVGGYIGDSTRREIKYANASGKIVRYLAPGGFPVPASTTERTVTVCDKCRRASCWEGESLCDESRSAGTVDVPVSVLRAEALESPHYWAEGRCDR